ncbi:MAG: hypothetical protein R2699_09130 [Acidimicrobiales bacterium]
MFGGEDGLLGALGETSTDHVDLRHQAAGRGRLLLRTVFALGAWSVGTPTAAV